MSHPLQQLRAHSQKSFNDLPSATMTMLFLGVAVVALVFAFFVHNNWLRAGALAYFLLP